MLGGIAKSKSAAAFPVAPVHKSLIPKQQAPPVFLFLHILISVSGRFPDCGTWTAALPYQRVADPHRGSK